MLWVAVATAAQPAPPEVVVGWRGAVSVLTVTAPPGYEIGETAPGALDLRSGPAALHFELDGAVLALGVPLGDLRGSELTGELSVPLCDEGGAECRPTRWTLRGTVPQKKRAGVALDVVLHEAPRPFGPAASAAPADEAFARAADSGKPVLLDFSAVWCPPCNQLALEVLHADPPADELAGFEVAVLDADHPGTFALKDRYDVGGYPTVVVVDATGREATRMVGYPGRREFLDWLAAAPGSSDAADLAKDPSALTPERAQALARKSAIGDAERARALLPRASEGPDSVDLRLARALLDPTADDVRWLLEHAPAQAMDYAQAAVSLAEDEPELARAVMEQALRTADGVAVADALWLAADLAPDEAQKRLLYSGAVGALRAGLTSDLDRDKPHLTWLATLLEDSGDAEGAIALLERASAHFPAEPTYDLKLAPMLLALERKDEALAAAERAVARSWGDNRLRAVAAQADVLVAMGRQDEARRVAEAELAAQAEPPEGSNPRTRKYRERLRKFVEGS